LIAQCGDNQDADSEESFSCNTAICLDCALRYFDQVEARGQPLETCDFCGHSLLIQKATPEKSPSKHFKFNPTNISNIEELDAEYEDSADKKGGQLTNRDIDIFGQRSISKTEHSDTCIKKIPQLRTLLIRDASNPEKEELKLFAKESVVGGPSN